MSNYVLTAEADEDLAGIWKYIAQDNVEAADRWDTKLRDAFEMLARNSRLGHTRTDLTDLPVLFWPVGAYLILYRVRKKRLEIVAVTHGARDIPSFLSGRTQ
jgi:plasmid stabilization system protein ParE